MAKVKIQGHASGTGILTVTAPNTSTDRTITLPDATGTLLNSDGDGSSLTGVGVDGISSSATATTITIDSDDQVGIRTTPRNFLSSYASLSLGGKAFLWDVGDEFYVGNNAYHDGSWKYTTTDQASYIKQVDGTIKLEVAPSGSADAAITWTTAIEIDNNGKLEGGSTSQSQGCLVWNGYGTEAVDFRRYSDTGDVAFFRDDTVVSGTISVSGSTCSYNTSSDYRLKEDVKPMSASIDRLKELKPVNFAWKVDGSRVDGFLAHEAQEVVPEAINGIKDGMRTEEYEVDPAIEATYGEEGNELTPAVEAVMGEREVEDYQGIDQSKLVPLLTSALQEAVAKIEELTTRIETLEAN